MGRNSGGNDSGSSSLDSGRTGPGFTEPIRGPKEASSNATEIQYVYVDKLTGNESNGYASETAVRNAIRAAERNDRHSGVYERDSYYIQRVENIRGQGRSQYYHTGNG